MVRHNSRFCIASLLIKFKMNLKTTARLRWSNQDDIDDSEAILSDVVSRTISWTSVSVVFGFDVDQTQHLMTKNFTFVFFCSVFFMIAIRDLEACLMLLSLEVLPKPIEPFYGEKIKTSWKRVSLKSSSNVSALSASAWIDDHLGVIREKLNRSKGELSNPITNATIRGAKMFNFSDCKTIRIKCLLSSI